MRHTILFICFLFSYSAHCEIAISSIIGSHMVIQRDLPFDINGTSTNEKMVKVIFDGKTRNVICKDGKWSVSFGPMGAGGPYEIQLLGDNEIVLEDIYFGDVYLLSGQSNMEWPLKLVNNPEKELEDTNYPMIRHFTVKKDLLAYPTNMLKEGEWQIANSESIADFSGIGFLFGKEIHKQHNIPIGLIDNAWGGSEIAPYMSEDCFSDKKDHLDKIQEFKSSGVNMDVSIQLFTIWREGLDKADLGKRESWHLPTTNREDWEDATLPGQWEQSLWPDYDGIGWYAFEFELDQIPQGNTTINLGQIDDADFTYINGKLIGYMDNAHNITRAYETDNSVFQKGKNVIVIRMTDYVGGGGLSASSEEFNITFENNEKISLAGVWKAKKGTANYNKPKNILNQNDYPTSKYNGMVSPLHDTKLSGILWYQGESDWYATKDYQWKSIRMISDYRDKWNQDKLPFFFVQLANWQEEAEAPAQSNWGELREYQEHSLSLSNTAMVTAIDIGDAEDIHPRDKQTVAKRIVLAANAIIYGKEGEYRSPRFADATISDEGYLITFDHSAGGLMVKKGTEAINGFSLLTEGKMKYIDAKIISKNQILIPFENPQPTFIRYLWADNPGEVSLYNDLGLPALPFQTFAE